MRYTVRHLPSILMQSYLIAHDKGPIIRINPNEIHISDPDFYDIIYSHTRVNKPESYRDRFGVPGSMVSTPNKDLHHNRRAALASYFSRRQVLEFTPYIQKCVDKLCRRLNNEYKGMFKVVKLDDAFAAFSSDNIIYFAFARTYDFLNYPDFSTPFVQAIDSIFDASLFSAHFPWVIPLMESLPKCVLNFIQPSIIPFFDFREVRVKFHISVGNQKLPGSSFAYRRSKPRYVKPSTAKIRWTRIWNMKEAITPIRKLSSRRFFTPIYHPKNC